MTGYLARHWRGQLPLAQTFWVNGLVSLSPFAVWVAFADTTIHAAKSASGLLLFGVLPFLALVLVDLWGAVGIWRCAGRQTIFGRRTPAWVERGAQAVVVANVVAVVAAMVLIADQSRAILRGPPPVTPAYEVTLRGNTAVFQGRMNTAAAAELELLLSDKSVRRLAIARSTGGEVGSTAKLVKLIHARKLFVVALANCDSACTALFSAGDVRAIVPQTILNFGTGPEPPLRRLIAAGVITTIFDARTRHYVRAPIWCAKNPVVCARTGSQNAQARSGGDGKDGA